VKKRKVTRQKATKKPMTDKPLAWPHIAREARDRSAEELQHIIRLLTPILEGPYDADVKLRVAKALISAHLALRHLESRGAPTRPD
jgi:hypothetical protein